MRAEKVNRSAKMPAAVSEVRHRQHEQLDHGVPRTVDRVRPSDGIRYDLLTD